MKKFIPLMAAVLAPSLFAAPVKGKADLLATNTVIARFDGFTEIPCRHMTADCPDKCDHATKVANFTVLVNEDYKQPGKYGADKAEVGSTMMVDVKKPTPGQDDAAVFETIDTLKLGDKVIMTQDHCYGEIGDLVTPFRPVTKLEIIPGAKEEIPATEAPAGDYSACPIQPRMMR